MDLEVVGSSPTSHPRKKRSQRNLAPFFLFPSSHIRPTSARPLPFSHRSRTWAGLARRQIGVGTEMVLIIRLLQNSIFPPPKKEKKGGSAGRFCRPQGNDGKIFLPEIDTETQHIKQKTKEKTKKYFASMKNVHTFASAFEKKALIKRIGPVVQFG